MNKNEFPDKQALAAMQPVCDSNDPSNRPALTERIATYKRERDFEAILRISDTMLRADPRDLGAVLHKAVALRGMDRPDRARALLEDCLHSGAARAAPAKQRITLSLEWIKALQDLGALTEALAAAQTVVDEHPDHLGAVRRLIHLQRLSLDLSAAIATCRDALQRWPEEAQFTRLLFSLLMSAGDLPRAEATLARSAHPLDEQWAEYHLSRRSFAEAGAVMETARRGDGPMTPALEMVAAPVTGAPASPPAAPAGPTETPKRAARHAAEQLDAMCCVDQARAYLDGLSPQVQTAQIVQTALARVLRDAGQFAQSAEVLGQVAETDASPLACVKRMLKDATALGLFTAEAKAILASLDRLLTSAEQRLPPFTCDVLRMHVAFDCSDWRGLLRLSDRVCDASPHDMSLLLMRARALFETGQFQRSRNTLAIVLSGHPCLQPAIELHAALSAALSGGGAGMDYTVAQLRDGVIPLELKHVRDLLMLERRKDLADLLAARGDLLTQHERYLYAELERFMANPSTRFDPPAGKAIAARAPLSAAELDELCAGALGPIASPARASTTAFVAAFHQGDACIDPDDWIARAQRATYCERIIQERSIPDDYVPDIKITPEFAAVQERVRTGQSSLLVSSHLGAPKLVALFPFVPDVAYVVSGTPRHDHLRPKAISVSNDRASAQIVTHLRRGTSVYSAPDFPASRFGQADAAAICRGRLFGTELALSDWVPKVSQAMQVPIFWVQPIWRHGAIEVDVCQMPMAQPSETTGAWVDRWAQDYLDLLAGVMTSGPENQTLTSPIWTFFQLRHQGRLERKNAAIPRRPGSG